MGGPGFAFSGGIAPGLRGGNPLREGESLAFSEGMDFPTTQWTALALASLNGDTSAHQALEQFFLRYREPVVRTLRRRGVVETKIEDMTHDFFLQLMESSSLKRADPARGRFRQFISGALSHFLADDVLRQSRQKRGGGAVHLSLDAGDGIADEAACPGAFDDAALDRDWAISIFGRALEALAAAWRDAGKTDRFAVLRCFLPGTQENLTAQEGAVRLGMSDGNFRSELSRLRTQFRGLLRTEVAATVASPADIDDEMQHLRRVISG